MACPEARHFKISNAVLCFRRRQEQAGSEVEREGEEEQHVVCRFVCTRNWSVRIHSSFETVQVHELISGRHRYHDRSYRRHSSRSRDSRSRSETRRRRSQENGAKRDDSKDSKSESEKRRTEDGERGGREMLSLAKIKVIENNFKCVGALLSRDVVTSGGARARTGQNQRATQPRGRASSSRDARDRPDSTSRGVGAAAARA